MHPLDARATVLATAATEALTAVLAADDAVPVIGAAIERALACTGAPTRPGGSPGVLADRLAGRLPLCDDTDLACPLGGFRDWSIRPGTLGELLSALCVGGFYAGDIVVERLMPLARANCGGVLEAALDDAEAAEILRIALWKALRAARWTHPLTRG